MKKFNLEDYKGNYAMHCDTKEKSIVFCEFLHEAEYRWCNDEVYKGNPKWKRYKEETAYFFNSGTFSSVDYAKKDGYAVLEFDDFSWNDMDERGLKLAESETDIRDKFDWDAFKCGDVTVTFKTNESQRQFLKRCETHGLKWASSENPNYRSAVDFTPMVYDWDARKYTKRAENPNTDWTAEEIEQAKELSRKLMCKIFDDGDSIKFVKVWGSPCEMSVVFYNRFGSVSDIFKSKPSGGDKFNEWIGKCVCLCKATQTPIPSFILDKNK